MKCGRTRAVKYVANLVIALETTGEAYFFITVLE